MSDEHRIIKLQLSIAAGVILTGLLIAQSSRLQVARTASPLISIEQLRFTAEEMRTEAYAWEVYGDDMSPGPEGLRVLAHWIEHAIGDRPAWDSDAKCERTKSCEIVKLGRGESPYRTQKGAAK